MTTRKIRKNITKKKRTRGGGGVKRLRSNSQSSKKTKHQRQISPSPSVSSLSGYNSRDSKASPMELEYMTKEEFVDLTYMNHEGHIYKGLQVRGGIILEGEPVTLSYNTGWGDRTISNGINKGTYEAIDMRFISKNGARFSKGILVAQGGPLQNGYSRAFVEEYNTHEKAPIRPEHMEYIYYNEGNISKKDRKLHKKLEKSAK